MCHTITDALFSDMKFLLHGNVN